VQQRWVRVGLLALVIAAVNVISRFITWKFELADASQQTTLGVIAIAAVGAVLIASTVWWAIRYPFPRVVGDIGVATIAAAMVSLLLGPFAGGSKPFAEGLGVFVGEFLMFLGIAFVGALVGFLGLVALGKDWKSRGLRRYEENYHKRRHRAVRG
jgi:hypothetical protein